MNTETKRGIPAISAESVRLREVLKLTAINEIVTTEGLARAINVTPEHLKKHEHCIRSAIKALESDGIVFHRVLRTGWKRIDPKTGEIIDGETSVAKRVFRKVRRSLRRLASVDFAALPNTDKIRHSTVAAQLGAIQLFAGNSAKEKIHAATIGNGQRPDNSKVLELFK